MDDLACLDTGWSSCDGTRRGGAFRRSLAKTDGWFEPDVPYHYPSVNKSKPDLINLKIQS